MWRAVISGGKTLVTGVGNRGRGAAGSDVPEPELPIIGILASGEGTTAEAVIRATQTGVLQAKIGLVISNNGQAGVFSRVERLNKEFGLAIPTRHISAVTHPGGPGQKGEQTLGEAQAIADACAGFSLVVLLGYMKKVHGPALALPMVNTHPGPLPQTAGLYGIYAQERVLQLGLPYSAQVLHWVAGGYDEGGKIAVHRVRTQGHATAQSLFAAVQAREKACLPVDLNRLLHTGARSRRRSGGAG